jgi:hypothetical protein
MLGDTVSVCATPNPSASSETNGTNHGSNDSKGAVRTETGVETISSLRGDRSKPPSTSDGTLPSYTSLPGRNINLSPGEVVRDPKMDCALSASRGVLHDPCPPPAHACAQDTQSFEKDLHRLQILSCLLVQHVKEGIEDQNLSLVCPILVRAANECLTAARYVILRLNERVGSFQKKGSGSPEDGLRRLQFITQLEASTCTRLVADAICISGTEDTPMFLEHCALRAKGSLFDAELCTLCTPQSAVSDRLGSKLKSSFTNHDSMLLKPSTNGCNGTPGGGDDSSSSSSGTNSTISGDMDPSSPESSDTSSDDSNSDDEAGRANKPEKGMLKSSKSGESNHGSISQLAILRKITTLSQEQALGSSSNVLDFQKVSPYSIPEVLHDEVFQANESGRAKLLKADSAAAQVKMLALPNQVIPVDSTSIEKWLQESCAPIMHILGTSGKFTMLCCEKHDVEALKDVIRKNPKDYPKGLLDSLPRYLLQIQTAYLPFVKQLISKWERSKPFDLDDSRFEGSEYPTGARLALIFDKIRAGNTLTSANRKKAGLEGFVRIRFDDPLYDVSQWILKAVRAAVMAIALGNTQLAEPGQLWKNLLAKIYNGSRKASAMIQSGGDKGVPRDVNAKIAEVVNQNVDICRRFTEQQRPGSMMLWNNNGKLTECSVESLEFLFMNFVIAQTGPTRNQRVKVMGWW